MKGDFLGLGTRVGDHSGADAILDCLGNVVCAHEVVEEEIQTRELVNESEVIQGDRMLASLAIGDVSPNARTILFNVDNQVLELFFMHLEVLHDHVMAQTIALVKILNVIEQVLAVFLSGAVHGHTVKVKRHGEEDSQTGACVDVTADVLVVKSNVPPGTRSL